jgi:DNA polymerase
MRNRTGTELALADLRRRAAECRACDLWKRATQTVFGAGPSHADVMLVGEQPGDAEDRAGSPFVGPAGRILDEALARAGIDRSGTYVTNVVKHFKWEPRGKRRLHSKPNQVEIAACRRWLEAEVAVVQPRVLVCLGATAAQAILGRGYRVTIDHGKPVASALAPHVVATVHPSSILRAQGQEERHRAIEGFIADLKIVVELLG